MGNLLNCLAVTGGLPCLLGSAGLSVTCRLLAPTEAVAAEVLASPSRHACRYNWVPDLREVVGHYSWCHHNRSVRGHDSIGVGRATHGRVLQRWGNNDGGHEVESSCTTKGSHLLMTCCLIWLSCLWQVTSTWNLTRKSKGDYTI
jgi:hypothetical protein